MSLETLSQLMTIQAAVGNALTVPQQIFVSANYKKFAEYLNSDAGRASVRTFVDDWQRTAMPPTPKVVESTSQTVVATESAPAATSTSKTFATKPVNYKVKL